MKKIILWILIALTLVGLFSYKLTKVPGEITIDEAAFGYNSVLLSRTLHDENGRKLPIFILSINGTDWRQPVTQYFMAGTFKILGPSLFNLRLTSVITTVAAILLIYLLAFKLFQNKIAAIASAVFLGTTPIIMIQSHLALDNITPLPFVILWLIFMFVWNKTGKKRFLIFSALALGIGFYSYKGMRVFVPIWIVSSTLYIFKDWLLKRTKKMFIFNLKSAAIFIGALIPFFAIIPPLEFLYAGAVLNKQHIAYEGLSKLLYPYLAAFDPSFLFIKGDGILIHSTGIYGMYLLGSLPFFLFGLGSVWKKSSFWKFIIISFFAGPILFGTIGSIHRGSRMLAEVPLYTLIAGAGFISLWERKQKIILGFFGVIFLINYISFIHYYFTNYFPAASNEYQAFICPEKEYKFLKEKSLELKLTPVVDEVIARKEGEPSFFAQAIYFKDKPAVWNGNKEEFPDNGILMTDNDSITYLKKVGNVCNLFFYTN